MLYLCNSTYIENASFEHSDLYKLYLLYFSMNFTWGRVTFLHLKGLFAWGPIYFFLNFFFLHSNENNEVGFVKFSTPDFVENLP